MTLILYGENFFRVLFSTLDELAFICWNDMAFSRCISCMISTKTMGFDWLNTRERASQAADICAMYSWHTAFYPEIFIVQPHRRVCVSEFTLTDWTVLFSLSHSGIFPVGKNVVTRSNYNKTVFTYTVAEWAVVLKLANYGSHQPKTSTLKYSEHAAFNCWCRKIIQFQGK